ncbi:MAG: RNA polymerase sigma factor [Hominisplanchenecus sp.]
MNYNQDKTQQKKSILIDEALFPGIGEGDKEAFCTLYRQTSSEVYFYALSLLHNRHDAEDAMQETFLKIRSAAHLYTPMGKPMAWILTIARNVCMMKYRQQKHHAEISMDEVRQEIDFSQIEDREDRIILETALKVLSPEECQIIIMHAVSGLRHREMSELLQLPLSTVLSKYHRGLKKLRKELEGKL